MLIPFWWIFVLIDAVRQARAINATGMPEPGFFGEERPFKADGGLTFGIFLTVKGIRLGRARRAGRSVSPASARLADAQGS